MGMAKFLFSAAAGLVGAGVALWPALPAQETRVPDFSPDSVTGWVAGDPNGENPTGQDFIAPESGPGPVGNDKAHPHIDDWRGAARRQTADVQGCGPDQSHSAALGARVFAQSQ